MNTTRVYETPFGINVFGSAIVKTDPNVVEIVCYISAIEIQPKEAFRKVKENLLKFRKYIGNYSFCEINNSRTSINQYFQFINGMRKFMGYEAKSQINIIVKELEMYEEVLGGIVENGVNIIKTTDFQTTKLKEIRKEARKKAIEAAIEKAINYCEAAKMELGKVVHIEDIDPDQIIQRTSHLSEQKELELNEGSIFEPGNISINAAVMVGFEIKVAL